MPRWQVLLAGDSGKVPVNLISSVPLTNLSMTVEVPTNRLANAWIESIVPEICLSVLTPSFAYPARGTEIRDLGLTTCSNQFLIGTQQVAWLHFTTVSNQQSAFVALKLDNTVGYQLDGTERRNFGPQSGQLVIVGEEPLLEATWSTNAQPILMLYAKPELSYDLLWSTGTSLDGAWPTRMSVPMSNLFQEITVPAAWPQQFYRARRE